MNDMESKPRTSIDQLRTERLLLKPFGMQDANALAFRANDKRIARHTRSLPYPYTVNDARNWIQEHQGLEARGDALVRAIWLPESADNQTAQLIGSIGLACCHEHEHAELGYWIGCDFWGRGFATEAGKAILTAGFEQLGLRRIHAHHLASNPASGRVLQKIGMQREGLLRQHVKKWGVVEDVVMYGILASSM